MSSAVKPVRILVSELGARADRWEDAWNDGDRPVLHLMQQPAENMGDFALRVREAMEALAEANRLPERVAIVGGGLTDADTNTARQFILRVLLTPMVRQGGGSATLVAEGRERLAMQSLAVTAGLMTRGTGVSLGVSTSDAAIAAA